MKVRRTSRRTSDIMHGIRRNSIKSVVSLSLRRYIDGCYNHSTYPTEIHALLPSIDKYILCAHGNARKLNSKFRKIEP
jgi:hypothetical protein